MANLRKTLLATIANMNNAELKALSVVMNDIVDSNEESQEPETVKVTKRKGVKAAAPAKRARKTKAADTERKSTRAERRAARLAKAEKPVRKARAAKAEKVTKPARSAKTERNASPSDDIAAMGKRELRDAVIKLQVKPNAVGIDLAKYLKKVYAMADQHKIGQLEKLGANKGVEFFFGRGRQTELGKKRKMSAQILAA